MKRYCNWAKKTPDELIQLKIEGLKSINTITEFQAEDLLETFLSTSKSLSTAKNGIRTAIISFYKHNRRPLVNITEVPTPESKKRCPKLNDILDLENAFTTFRDKFLCWFIASSPFRLGTITKLKWKDLKKTNDEEVPYFLKIESKRLKGAGVGKYKGSKQISFLHKFAVEKLEAYKQELDRKGYTITQDSPIFIAYRTGGRIKALSSDSIESIFGKASLKAWHDLEAKRFSPHDFRSFVQTALENAGINHNIIAPMLGHKPKGVDFHYSEHDIKDLLGKFKTAIPYLIPLTVGKIKAEHEIKFRQQDAKMKWQEERIRTLEQRLTDNGLSINKMITGLQSELLTLKSEVSNTKTDIRHLDMDIDDLQKKTKTKPKPIREYR